jgi:hypothetical protein
MKFFRNIYWKTSRDKINANMFREGIGLENLTELDVKRFQII